MTKSFIISVLVIIALVAMVSAYFAQPSIIESKNKIQVAATFYPLADFARQVGGDKVSVTNITPAGTEPHDFEPSPRDIIAIRKSRVFIYSGSNFEPWANKVAPDLPGVTVVKAGKGIKLLPAVAGEKAAGRNVDPHYYLDPVLDEKAVQNIADGLSKADPPNKAFYQKNADAYIAKLKELNKEYATGLKTCGSRDIVTSHAAFAYLAKRYNLKQIPIAGLSDQEPSAARLAQIAKFVKEHHIKYIFFEQLVSPRLSETIARETGAKTLVLNPIEGLTPVQEKAGKNFISLMKANLANLRLALSCK